MKRAHGRCVAAGTAILAFTTAPAAHAEYVENQMGRRVALITLATAGSVALGSDVVDVVYLAGGPGDEAGRLVGSIGSLLGSAGLVAGSSIALLEVGEEHIPGGADNDDSEEARAMTEARALAGINFGLAAVSVGLGIAALATYGDDGARPTAGSFRWRLQPMVLGADGGGAGIVGRF